MSRFFAASESESEEENKGFDDKETTNELQEKDPGSKLAARFTFDDSESDEERRVVRSQKEKRFDELQATIRILKNSSKIKDWTKILQDYDKIQNQISNPKLRTAIQQEGVPIFYLKTICWLSDFVEEAFSNKVARKKLSPSNAKALSKLRQQITKKNKMFLTELKEYRENPTEEDHHDEFGDSDADESSGQEDGEDDISDEDEEQ